MKNLALTLLFLVACGATPEAATSSKVATTSPAATTSPQVATPPATAALSISSSAFAPQGAIPRTFTCQGQDASPPLTWSGVPEGAKSLVLIVDDPDAPDPAHPQMTWVHWILYNMPPSATGLPEGVQTPALPAGTRAGRSDFKRTTWGGPCPPIGRHRYFFKLYALDITLDSLVEPSKAEVEKAMAGHVVGEAQLVGTYQKS